MHRISSQFNNTETQYQLRRQEVKQAAANRQIGTQSRIGELRDDPLAAGHLVRYESYLARVERFEKNAIVLSDRLSVREGYVNQNLQIMQRVRELAVGAANGTYTPDDLKAMAAETDELLKEMVQNANATGADGNSLFAGNRLKTTAFDVELGNVPGADEALIERVVYKGDAGVNLTEVDETAWLESSNCGSSTFWAEPQMMFGQRDLSSWQALEDALIKVDGIALQVSAGDNVFSVASKINTSGAAVKASVDPVTGGLNLATTDSHQIWLEDAQGSTLADMGLIMGGTHFPPNNIDSSTVKVTGGSLFDTVIALRDAMLKGDQETIGGRVLGSLDQGINNLTGRLAKIGSEYERAMINAERSSANQLEATRLVSREGDVDFTKAVMDLKMLEYVNQATMSNAGQMYSSTLLNYLR